MAKVPQQKDKDFDAIEPRINFTDMIEERRNACVEICREAYSKQLTIESILMTVWYFVEMQHDGELKYYKDMALHVKHEMEKKFQGSWHVIVGKLSIKMETEMLI